MKLIFLKIRHQLLLTVIPLIVTSYGMYFISFKINKNVDQSIFWFKTSVIYLNCLMPFLIALIIAIQFNFEETCGNLNHFLTLPSRGKWIWNFLLETLCIQVISVGIFNALIASFTKISDKFYSDLWLSLFLMNWIWIPILVLCGIAFNYRGTLAVGTVISPFLIYAATQYQEKLWNYLPWIYNLKIYDIEPKKIFMRVSIMLIVTVVEQAMLIYYVDHKLESGA